VSPGPNKSKTSRPQKPPITPRRPDQWFEPSLSTFQERRIGRVVVAWSKLENAMDDTIWQFLDLDLIHGRKITRRMDTTAKIGLLRVLSEARLSEERFQSIADTLDLIDLCREDRNFIVHGTWATSMPENIPIAASIRARANPDEIVSETFSAARMGAILADIEKLKASVISLRNELESQRGGAARD
jgi:hypothetical protein